MGIRGKLILSIICPVLISIIVVTVAVGLQLTGTVETNFKDASTEQLDLVDDYIAEVLSKAAAASRLMAGLEDIQGALGEWRRYFELNRKVIPSEFEASPSENYFQQIADAQMKANPDFAYVYAGLEDGGYRCNGDEELPAGYDPRKRPWYKEGKSSSTDTTLLSAYITTMGVPNIGVTTKIKGPGGKLVGISAVDISLEKLSTIVDTIKIGETGYLVVMQKDGTILADPRHKDFIFKKVQELQQKTFAQVFASNNAWLTDLELDGKLYYAASRTSEENGIVYAAFIEKDEIAAAAKSAIINIIIIGVFVATLFAVLGGVYITGYVVKPVQAMAGFAREIAAKNYRIMPDSCSYKDELCVLFDNLRTMVEELVKTISLADDKAQEAETKTLQAEEALKDAEQARAQAERAKSEGMQAAAEKLEAVVARIAAASDEISSQSDEIRIGADIQSQRISETATAMEEMNATVLEVAKNSSEAAEVGGEAKNKAQNGAQIVHQSIEAMQVTQDQIQRLKENMAQLGQQAEAIGTIMTVIEDIADQTNLLALNAAIEAARAGDAGRGFAVVADEVRKLAEKTMGATKEVGDSIRAIQDGARQNISSVEKAVEDMDKVVELTNRSGTVLGEIVQGVETSADQIQGIATAAEEQSATSEEINRSIDEVNRITMETSQGVSQTAQAVGELASQMAELSNLVQELKES